MSDVVCVGLLLETNTNPFKRTYHVLSNDGGECFDSGFSKFVGG